MIKRSKKINSSSKINIGGGNLPAIQPGVEVEKKGKFKRSGHLNIMRLPVSDAVFSITANVKVFVSGGHRYTLILTASCPPACTNTVLAAVYYE